MSLDTDGRVYNHACFVTAACFSSPCPTSCVLCVHFCLYAPRWRQNARVSGDTGVLTAHTEAF